MKPPDKATDDRPTVYTLDSSNLTRRSFLGGALAAGAAAALGCKGPHIVPRSVLGGPGHTPPSEKLRVAFIGVGGQGGGNPDLCRDHYHVAFCDVDDERAANNYKAYPDVKRYKDYRRMLEEHEKDIDVVFIATPDHSHALPSLMAMRMGKNVFCQKPLSHNIHEARLMGETARAQGVITQMGIQAHAEEGIRQLCEWIWAGAIGAVREVHVWSNRPLWPQGVGRPADAPPVPATLDWDLWLGPAPDRPYNPAYLPTNWRGWWDFGCGALGDIGCHAFDCVMWALELGPPTLVEAESSPVNDETAPKSSRVVYRFPKRKSPRGPTLQPVKLFWYDGGELPAIPAALEVGRRLDKGGGHIFIGDKGTIMTGDFYCGNPRIVPATRMRDFQQKPPPKTLPRSPGGYAEFLAACKGGPVVPGANFEYGSALTEIVHLGNVAIRAGKPIEWDARNMRVTNVPEANRFVRREYRKGWEI